MLWREQRGFARVEAPAANNDSSGSSGGGARRRSRSKSHSESQSRGHTPTAGDSRAGDGRTDAAVSGAAEGPAAAAGGTGGNASAAADGSPSPQESQLPALVAAAWPSWRRLRDPQNGTVFYLNPATGARRLPAVRPCRRSKAGWLYGLCCGFEFPLSLVDSSNTADRRCLCLVITQAEIVLHDPAGAVRQSAPQAPLPSAAGGILAEEMGLVCCRHY